MGIDSVILAFVFALRVAQAAPEVILSDERCGMGERLVGDLAGIVIRGTCEIEATRRVLRISVTNTTPFEDDGVRGFSVGFCSDPIVRAEAPQGWEAHVRRDAVGSRIEWRVSVPSTVAQHAVGSRQTLNGFVVEVEPNWRLSRSFLVDFKSVTSGTGMTHTCTP